VGRGGDQTSVIGGERWGRLGIVSFGAEEVGKEVMRWPVAPASSGGSGYLSSQEEERKGDQVRWAEGHGAPGRNGPTAIG
jgi:hypothetical protein